MNYLRLLKVLFIALAMLIACAPAPSASAQKAAQLTDAEVDKAIEDIKKFFYDAQDPVTGGWYGSYHKGPEDGKPDKDGKVTNKNAWGPTAMAVLALIASGESPQNPKIAKALELLAQVEISGVYALSMRAHVWSYLPQSVYGGALLKDAETMIQSSYKLSQFNYIVYGMPGFNANDSRVDNSTTQYGLLALWQASKRGINVPQGFWADAVENFLKQQSDLDGGWAYSGNRNTTQSMTLAGLTCMYVAQQELFRDKNTPDKAVSESIQKGLAYLDKNFKVGAGVHGGASYMWYGYERVGLASGRKFFGTPETGFKDWYQEIGRAIVNKKGKYGGAIHTASFDLMFLARGRVPVWINKLEIPGVAWNNRPNDVYFLNRFISEYREHEVNWQVVSINSDPKEWVAAPLMWLSSNNDIEWTESQIAKIKKYIDLGGTLIANPEGKSSSFRASIENLAEKMYPNLKWSAMERTHPMANLLEGDPKGSRAPNLRMLSNGARVLIVMPNDDWGMTFQKDKKPDPDRVKEWRHIINIYGVVTDRGQLTPRLSSPMVKRESRESTGKIKVVIPQWTDENALLPENDVYVVMRNYMFNATGKELIVEQLPLSELASANPSLLHLVGFNAVEISAEERKAIQDYITKGGTVLVENLGGTGEFAASVVKQMSPVFSLVGGEGVVNTRKQIINGRRLPEGNTNNADVYFRRMVLEKANPSSELTLRGHLKGDRYPVLVSYQDLSLGMLGVKQYGINGYSIETSRDLMINILLEANIAHAGSTSAATAE